MTESSDYLILFGDLVDSTEVAVEASPSFFARTYVASFHWAANKAMAFISKPNVFRRANLTKRIADIKIAGDEVHSFTSLSSRLSEEKLQDLVASAVSFAYVLKLYWLAAPYNLGRMLGKQFPRDISIGIHIGPAAAVDPRKKSDSDVAGLHINITKRIETQARSGSESRIFASKDVTHLFDGWSARHQNLSDTERPPLLLASFLERSEPMQGKGVPKKLRILELVQARTDMDSMIRLLGQLKNTPEIEDVEAERAARIMAETFIQKNRHPFSHSIDYHIPGADSAVGYIDKWFEAMKLSPRLFLDEPWLILNCFVVSCALVRHPALSKKKREYYQAEGEKIHGRLVQLIEAGKRHHPS